MVRVTALFVFFLLCGVARNWGCEIREVLPSRLAPQRTGFVDLVITGTFNTPQEIKAEGTSITTLIAVADNSTARLPANICANTGRAPYYCPIQVVVKDNAGDTITCTVTPPELDLYITDKTCGPGTYWGGSSCTQCPTGGRCFGDERIVARPGYWSAIPDSVNIEKCDNVRACSGGIQPACTTGYVGPRCEDCAEGYEKRQGDCREQASKGEAILRMTLIAILACSIIGGSAIAYTVIRRRRARAAAAERQRQQMEMQMAHMGPAGALPSHGPGAPPPALYPNTPAPGYGQTGVYPPPGHGGGGGGGYGPGYGGQGYVYPPAGQGAQYGPPPNRT